VEIRENIGWKNTKYKWDGMVMGIMGRWEALEVFKN
jgi:hypothetical protein